MMLSEYKKWQNNSTVMKCELYKWATFEISYYLQTRSLRMHFNRFTFNIS